MRAWLAWALACAACGTPHPLFVDQVEDGRALLVDDEGHAVEIDARRLPADAGEGAWWVDGRRDLAQERARTTRVRALRQKLAGGDDGGDFALAP